MKLSRCMMVATWRCGQRERGSRSLSLNSCSTTSVTILPFHKHVALVRSDLRACCPSPGRAIYTAFRTRPQQSNFQNFDGLLRLPQLRPRSSPVSLASKGEGGVVTPRMGSVIPIFLAMISFLVCSSHLVSLHRCDVSRRLDGQESNGRSVVDLGYRTAAHWVLGISCLFTW